MTRKNVISIVFQNSKSKKCSCSKDQKRGTLKGALPRHYGAPVAMALYYQGDQVYRYNRRIAGAPAPKGGRAGARGPGAFNTTRN